MVLLLLLALGRPLREAVAQGRLEATGGQGARAAWRLANHNQGCCGVKRCTETEIRSESQSERHRWGINKKSRSNLSKRDRDGRRLSSGVSRQRAKGRCNAAHPWLPEFKTLTVSGAKSLSLLVIHLHMGANTGGRNLCTSGTCTHLGMHLHLRCTFALV